MVGPLSRRRLNSTEDRGDASQLIAAMRRADGLVEQDATRSIAPR